jgi:hypothetical protein
MAIQGMYSWQLSAYNFDDDLVPVTWDAHFPSSNAFIQVHLGDLYEFDDKSAAEIAIVQLNSLPLPDPDATNSLRVAWQNGLTYMKVQMNVKNVWAFYVVQVFVF